MTIVAVAAVLAFQQTALTAPLPRVGGTLVLATDEDADRLDPNLSGQRASTIVYTQIFEPLILRDPKDKAFKPWLATSWQASPDGKTYTFRLRQDVKFHDGTPFNAAAVKFNFDRTHNPALSTRCVGCALGFYDSAEVVDPFTVRVHLKSPWAPFLDALTTAYLMVSPTAVAKAGDRDFGRQPVGSGPFRFVEWIPNDRIVLERNPDYTWSPAVFTHRGKAYLDRVIYKVIPEPSSRVAALETGEVQLVRIVSSEDFQRLVKDARYAPVVGLLPGVPWTWAINTTKFPTSELAVRQALNLGIDREIIAKAVFRAFQAYGAFRPAYTLYSPVSWAYDKSAEPYSFDRARASSLLDGAGWRAGPDGIREKAGQRLEIYLVSWEHGVPELMQAQLRRIGISLRVGILDTLSVNAAQRRGESHMGAVPASRTDPDILSLLLHSRNVGGGFNFSFVKDPELDRLLDQGAIETNLAQRRQFYVRAARLAMERAYMLPVHTRDNIGLASTRVQGLRFDAAGLFPMLHDVWLAP